MATRAPSPDPAPPARAATDDEQERCWHCLWLHAGDVDQALVESEQEPGRSVCVDAWSCWLRQVSLDEHLSRLAG